MIDRRRHSASLCAGFALSILIVVPLVWAGPLYMNDANTRAPVADPSVTELTDDFPRILAHEFAGNQSNAEYSKYMLIASKGVNFPRVEEIQISLSPQTKLLRHISARAYQSWNYKQCFISGGLAFEDTTPASQGGPSASGCGIYAGHWLYRPGTRLAAPVSESAEELDVEDASRIQAGQYVVIYAAPAGSFENAEHARVVSVNRSSNSITVARGFKSTAGPHAAGAIVAQHVLGQGSDARLWAFNLSSQSPRDADGRTFGEFYANWLGMNLLRYKDGVTTGADVAGVMFDADFYYDLKASETDANNDLELDNGVSVTGANWLGEGLEDFYSRVRAELPGKYVIVGHQYARGYGTAHGAQLESWIDYGNADYSPNPVYRKVNEMFSRYLFNMSEREIGPPLVQTLTKTPTKQYPGDSGSAVSSNAPFRFALAMALMEDGYFGTHSGLTAHAWWDEYAVFTNPEDPNFGAAVPDANAAAARDNRGWLGQPTGDFERVYDESLFQADGSMLANGTFDQNINGWRSDNVSLSRDTASSTDGTASLRVSGMINYQAGLGGASVKSERLAVSAGQGYTLAVSLRSDADREIRVSLGNDSARVPLSARWRRYVFTLRPTKDGLTALKFALGMEGNPVWIDSVYLFEGDANVFRREFDRGLAIANATPHSRTIVVGAGYRRIAGTQDPVVNNGEDVTEVTIPPYDGLLLVKADAVDDGGGGGSAGSGFIGDRVWRDENGDGSQDPGEPGWSGITVELLGCEGDYIASTASGNDGDYAFDQLGVGRYRIAVKAPSDAEFSPRTGGGPDNSDVDPETGRSWCAEITPQYEQRRSLDAGLVPAGSGTGSIGDRVWNDLNGDGIQNNAEPGVAGLTVRLRECNGVLRDSTMTGSSGNYRFSGLAAEAYLVEFVLPAGASFTLPQQGSSRGKDSNADPATGLAACVDLAMSPDRTGIDAGIRL